MGKITKNIEIAAPLNFFVVLHNNGVVMTDKEGRMWKDGGRGLTFVALFSSKKTARRALQNARNKPTIFQGVRIHCCALVMPKSKKGGASR